MTNSEEILAELPDVEQHFYRVLGEQLPKLEQLMEKALADGDTEVYLKVLRQYTTVHRQIAEHVHQDKRDKKVDEFKQAQLDRLNGTGGELSPLERWLDSLEG